MKLKNILIVVKDIEKAKQFYQDLFGLQVLLHQDGNVILTEGLVLQEETLWKNALAQDVIWKNHASALYFEEPNLQDFVKKMENLYPSIAYVNELMTYGHGQKMIRFYDLDGNLIEVRTPVN